MQHGMSANPVRCLVVDDDDAIRSLLSGFLQQHGMAVETLASGSALRQRPRHGLGGCDVLVLDLMLPDDNGLDLCQWAKRTRPDLPVIMLTAQGDPISRVLGLELGADDYLGKPFEPRELVARVQTILRRQRPPQAPAPQRLTFDGLVIDLDRREVLRHGAHVDLTGTEFELLALLARQPGKVWSRDDILNQLRGQEAELFTRAVDIVVSRLRKKLEPLDCIKTLRNAGYALAVAP